jgi:hypothetical protein
VTVVLLQTTTATTTTASIILSAAVSSSSSSSDKANQVVEASFIHLKKQAMHTVCDHCGRGV